MKPLAWIDLEGTGLVPGPDAGEITEIAILWDKSLKLPRCVLDSPHYTPKGVGGVYHTKVRPAHIETADPRSLQISGYREEEWVSAPLFQEIAHEICEILNRVTICAHNSPFDRGFIVSQLDELGIKHRIRHMTVDTLALSYEHLCHTNIKSISMPSLRRLFGWSSVGAHTALKDAEDCRRLYHTLARASYLKRLWWTILVRWRDV